MCFLITKMTKVTSVRILWVSTKAEGPGAVPGSPEEGLHLMPRTTDASGLAVTLRSRVSIFCVHTKLLGARKIVVIVHP